MTGITEYFDNLRYNAKNAQTKKALKVLLKHGRRYVKMIVSNPNISSEAKERARRELMELSKAIREVEKRLPK